MLKYITTVRLYHALVPRLHGVFNVQILGKKIKSLVYEDLENEFMFCSLAQTCDTWLHGMRNAVRWYYLSFKTGVI